ncbi:tyrosyl-DNA phosphodiesterase-domain-containing protein [Podospora didyma]|uniref:Tyrosyl-DNA phosphodiesterase-domain-containing protein n=1 Tax=Podospora didyma TaxID=330526 RepID=A0AAE0NZD7_9PEZI|nr:tyrosyl-DNA phosphodiesterase-domain-containing protein [Podospora didyma]
MEKDTKRLLLRTGNDEGRPHRRSSPISLTHPVSPPPKRRKLSEHPPREIAGSETASDVASEVTTSDEEERERQKPISGESETQRPDIEKTDISKKLEGPSLHSQGRFSSPFHLTKIRDLVPELNIDAVTLEDILGDPLISECWEFNYLHDIDFLLNAFDQDVRNLVKVHVIHGFWKREDSSRLQLQEQASRHSNVTLHSAFMPEMFGTHHSKMMILLRHDETAQIVIHTANMIVRDWTNMTQAVWLSPRLPLIASTQPEGQDEEPRTGSGAKFKIDFLNYLRSYDTRQLTCKPIIDELIKYDFSAIKGYLIASVPGRHNVRDDSPTRWGWAAMKQALRAVPVHAAAKSEIAIQISSIATLGPTDNWLKNTLFRALSGGQDVSEGIQASPGFKVIFPTADEIRNSLDGYDSGGSIHTKIQSGQQAKQLQYLKPIFCHWANDSVDGAELNATVPVQEAGRDRAAPHIKTFIRYGTKPASSSSTIDWALVTSANLSKQAWGEAVNTTTGEMRIASYEIGVLVWPALFAEDAIMKPSFLKDTVNNNDDDGEKEGAPVVALRLPYSLPLQAYGKSEIPWVATASHVLPDWKGEVWTE